MSVRELIERVAALPRPDAEGLGEILGTAFEPKQRTDTFQAFDATVIGGPFAGATLRLFHDDQRAIVTLSPIDDLDATLAELELEPWGAPIARSYEPRVPPAGLTTDTYRLGTVDTTIALRADTGTLDGVTLKWGMS